MKNRFTFMRMSAFSRRRMAGMTLLELMIALVLSTTVLLGLITLINSIGIANRTQDGLARLQENGRFAVQRIAADVRAASSQHCSNFEMAPSILAGAGVMYMDPARNPTMNFDAGDANPPLLRMGLPGPVAPYELSSRFFMVGHECTTVGCTPLLTNNNRGVDRLGAGLPVMGTAAGLRARGADVLTLRYLAGDGAAIVSQAPGVLRLTSDVPVLARSGFAAMANNDPVWVSDCATSSIFLGQIAGQDLSLGAGNFGAAVVPTLQRVPPVAGFAPPRLPVRAFHIPTSLRTVTYFLQVTNDPKVAGRRISSLVRRENGVAQVLVEGVERFDLLYGVRNAGGATRFVSATQVDALAGAACSSTLEPGCGWRTIGSVEIFLLLNTVDDVVPRGDDEFRYAWLNNGVANVAGTFENPATFGTLRNGLPAGRMLRREFRTLVSLRGINY